MRVRLFVCRKGTLIDRQRQSSAASQPATQPVRAKSIHVPPHSTQTLSQQQKDFHSGALEGTAEPATLDRLRTRSVSRLEAAARQGTPIPPQHPPSKKLDVAAAFGTGPPEEEATETEPEAAIDDNSDASSPIPLRFSPPPATTTAPRAPPASAAAATASPSRGSFFARFSSPPKSAPGAISLTGAAVRPQPQQPGAKTAAAMAVAEQQQQEVTLTRPSATAIQVSVMPRSPAHGRGKGGRATVVALLVGAVLAVAWLAVLLLVAARVEVAALGIGNGGQRAGRASSWRSLL